MIPRISKIRAIQTYKKSITLPPRKEDSKSQEPVSLVNEAIGQNIDTYA